MYTLRIWYGDVISSNIIYVNNLCDFVSAEPAKIFDNKIYGRLWEKCMMMFIRFE